MSSAVQLPSHQQPEDPLESPEVLIINALLEAPEGFKPEAYGVSKDMLAGYTKAWQFCVDHQESSGEPPSRELFARTFPDFELLSGVKPVWAADRLRAAHRERDMRRNIKAALDLLTNGEVEAAQDKLTEMAKRPVAYTTPRGLSMFDESTVEDTGTKAGYAVPWFPLEQATGGVAAGEFWGIGARLGQGKSQMLPLYADTMAEVGARIAIHTYEMPKRSYIRRLQRIRGRFDPSIRRGLRSSTKEERLEALRKLPPLPGTIEVFDLSDLEPSPNSIRLLTQEYQFVFIDHLGLMTNNKGMPAISDWRVAGEISNELKRITLEQHAGIVAAVQVNRDGERKGFLPPEMHQLAGTDDIGKDLDVAVLMRRMGERTMLHHLAKNREGKNVVWYTKYEPEDGDFSEITKDTALDRARMDGDRDL